VHSRSGFSRSSQRWSAVQHSLPIKTGEDLPVIKGRLDACCVEFFLELDVMPLPLFGERVKGDVHVPKPRQIRLLHQRLRAAVDGVRRAESR
jgi:hypothetical protein